MQLVSDCLWLGAWTEASCCPGSSSYKLPVQHVGVQHSGEEEPSPWRSTLTWNDTPSWADF